MTSLAFSAIVATAILYLNMLAVTQLIMSASAVQIDSAQDSVARHKASIALRSHAQKISALSLLPQSGGNLTSRYLIPDYLLQTYLLQTLFTTNLFNKSLCNTASFTLSRLACEPIGTAQVYL